MSHSQLSLFGAPETMRLPEGFNYKDDILSSDEERALVKQIAKLPFKEFQYQGFLGKRRVVSFGWRYDFNTRELNKAENIPEFLLPVRTEAGNFAGLDSNELQQALVTEYAAGAGIGWHKDRPEFGDIIGISLLAPCVFRLRRKIGTKWQRASIVAKPRSAYVMRGPARQEWQHNIPPLDTLRYSITFRTFRGFERVTDGTQSR
jgi:alkylated DNA repair dioxygenase AlkB